MNCKYIILPLLFFLLFITSNIYAQEEEKQKVNYRRIDPQNFPLPEYYQQPKEQVFPLGYGKNHSPKGEVGKVATGTGIWTELNPKVPRVDYIGLDFINADTGWVCGGSGAIIKTTNGGDDWTISQTPVTNLLLKINSYNGQIVIATGYDGLILRSSDEGENFVEIPSGVGTGTDLWGVQMINDTLGWICGMNQTLLKTTDGGLSWQFVYPGTNQHYWSLDFLNEQYGMIACGEGLVLKTTDGGNSWIEIQAGDTRSLYTIDIIDSLHIAAAGQWGNQFPYEGGKNVYSSDEGETWIENPDIPTFTDANWIEFMDRDTGYTVNIDKGIFKTTNRGQSWHSVGASDAEWQIDLLEDGTGYAVGEELNAYKRTNGLENWSRIFLNYDWSDVFFLSEMKGFLISADVLEGGVFKTEDGGISFLKIDNAPNGYDLLFLDSLTGFIAGTHKTTDGGETWYPTNGGGGTKVFFIDDTIGWSIGGNLIYKTTDRGENWFSQLIGSDSFKNIYFVNLLNGWAASRYVWQTTDGGDNWIERTDIPAFLTDDVYFYNLDTGWVAAYSTINPSLYKTTNGGLSWAPIPEVIGARKFHFFPDPVHWVINGFGLRYITTDYGSNWIDIMNEVPSGITSFHAPTNFLGYSGGSGGIILRYDDTTYVPVELVSFTGKTENNAVVLEWITASELNNHGFEIQRASSKTTPLQEWEKIGFVPGSGTTTEITYYSFNDVPKTNGIYRYRLKQIDFNGSFVYTNVVKIEFLINEYKLYQNYPNPFNPVTTIKYDLPNASVVSIIIYDILGRKIKTLVNEQQQPGRYDVQFDASSLASGVYLYQIRAKDFLATKKMIILR